MRLPCFLMFLFLLPCIAHARALDIVTYTPPISVQPLQLVTSSPAPNQQVAGSPKTVSLTFTQNVMPEKSSVKLYDQYNNLVNAPLETSQSATNSLIIDVPNLLAGAYRVDWTAQCLCTQNTVASSTFYFSVY